MRHYARLTPLMCTLGARFINGIQGEEKELRITRLVLAALVSCGIAMATTLTGTLFSPVGGVATGTLYLTGPTGVSLTNACGGVGGQTFSVPQFVGTVTNGVVSPANITGNDCFFPQQTVYQVLFIDSTTQAQFAGTWYISGTTWDVTTQVLGTPGNVVKTPSSTQTIAQPPGTTLRVNSFQATQHAQLPFGIGAPTGSCSNGDWYIQADGTVQQWNWECINSVWTNLTGGTGSGGGNTILNGAGVPSNGSGTNGDFYLRTSNNCLYGPKASGAWPGSCVALVGAAGTEAITANVTYWLCAKTGPAVCSSPQAANGWFGASASVTPSDSNDGLSAAAPVLTLAGFEAKIHDKMLQHAIVTLNIAATANTGSDCYSPSGVVFNNPSISLMQDPVAFLGPTSSFPDSYINFVGDVTTNANATIAGNGCGVTTTFGSGVYNALTFNSGTAYRIQGVKLIGFGTSTRGYHTIIASGQNSVGYFENSTCTLPYGGHMSCLGATSPASVIRVGGTINANTAGSFVGGTHHFCLAAYGGTCYAWDPLAGATDATNTVINADSMAGGVWGAGIDGHVEDDHVTAVLTGNFNGGSYLFANLRGRIVYPQSFSDGGTNKFKKWTLNASNLVFQTASEGAFIDDDCSDFIDGSCTVTQQPTFHSVVSIMGEAREYGTNGTSTTRKITALSSNPSGSGCISEFFNNNANERVNCGADAMFWAGRSSLPETFPSVTSGNGATRYDSALNSFLDYQGSSTPIYRGEATTPMVVGQLAVGTDVHGGFGPGNLSGDCSTSNNTILACPGFIKTTSGATMGAFLYDFSASTIKVPVIAGGTASAATHFLIDSTNFNVHGWDGSADFIYALVSGSVTNGHCGQLSKSGATIKLIDSGAPCGSGGNTFNGSGVAFYAMDAPAFLGTQFLPIGGGAAPNSTRGNVEAKIGTVVTISNPCVHANGLTGGGSIAFTLFANGSAVGSPGNVTMTVNSGTAACDNTNVYTTTAGDLLAWQAVTTGTVGTPTTVIDAQFGTGGILADLSNLSATNINNALLPQSGKALGSAAKNWNDAFMNLSGTYGSGYVHFTGTPTAPRAIRVPDADSSPVVDQDCTGTGASAGQVITKIANGLATCSTAVPAYRWFNSVINGTIAASSTFFATFQGTASFQSTAIQRQLSVPIAGTLKNLRMASNSLQPATGSGALVCTVQTASLSNSPSFTSTGITVTFASGSNAVVQSDTTHTQAVSAGDLIVLQCANSGTGNTAGINMITLDLFAAN